MLLKIESVNDKKMVVSKKGGMRSKNSVTYNSWDARLTRCCRALLTRIGAPRAPCIFQPVPQHSFSTCTYAPGMGPSFSIPATIWKARQLCHRYSRHPSLVLRSAGLQCLVLAKLRTFPWRQPLPAYHSKKTRSPSLTPRVLRTRPRRIACGN